MSDRQKIIDREIIHVFAYKGLFFEDAEHNNVVFVGFDENGVQRHIQKCATDSASKSKGNVDRSNADCNFNYLGTSDKLLVFGTTIDLPAYISLYK